MIKSTLLAAALAIAFASVSTAASPNASPPSSPSPPSPPAGPPSPSDRDSSAQRTNYSFAQDSIARRTMNPGFCNRNASDYYVKASKTICEGY